MSPKEGEDKVVERQGQKDVWDKLRALGTVLASVAIPIVLLVLNSTVAVTIKDKDVGLKKLELAISILMEPATVERSALRSWAARQVFPDDEDARGSVLSSPLLSEMRTVGDRLGDVGLAPGRVLEHLLEAGAGSGLALYQEADSIQSEALEVLKLLVSGDSPPITSAELTELLAKHADDPLGALRKVLERRKAGAPLEESESDK